MTSNPIFPASRAELKALHPVRWTTTCFNFCKQFVQRYTIFIFIFYFTSLNLNIAISKLVAIEPHPGFGNLMRRFENSSKPKKTWARKFVCFWHAVLLFAISSAFSFRLTYYLFCYVRKSLIVRRCQVKTWSSTNFWCCWCQCKSHTFD